MPAEAYGGKSMAKIFNNEKSLRCEIEMKHN